jgi:hypothetical protein
LPALLADRDIIQLVNEEPLNKGLFGRLSALYRASVISGLTAPQGFVFSLCFQALKILTLLGAPQTRRPNVKAKSGTGIIELLCSPRDIECTVYSGGAANGGRA